MKSIECRGYLKYPILLSLLLSALLSLTGCTSPEKAKAEHVSGGEAFLICEAFGAKIHLLLSDVIMPRMSGTTLAQQLKKSRPEAPVLYMSGYSEHGLPAGTLNHLQKPFTRTAFMGAVRKAIDQHLACAAQP